MNPTMNTIMGNTIINIMAPTMPAVPTTAPVGMVALVMWLLVRFVRLVRLVELVIFVEFIAVTMAFDIVGMELLNSAVIGANAAARNNPIINAHMASILASTRANDTTGTSVTSSPSNPSFIPPNLGTNAL